MKTHFTRVEKKRIYMSTSLFLVFALVWFICPGSRAQELSFRADRQNTGFYEDTTKNFVKLKWKYATGGMIISSPVVYDSTVYFGSNDGNVYALDTETADEKWIFETGGKVTSSPAITDTVLYILSMDSNLYALDIHSGEEIWRFTTGGESRRQVMGIMGRQPQDEFTDEFWDFYLSSPLIVDSLLFFGSSDTNIYALNRETGSVVWKTKTTHVVHSSPAYYEGKIFCGSWDSKIYALDAQTGDIAWSYQTGTDPGGHLMEGIQASPAVSEGIVYCGSRDAQMYALNAEDGTLVWKNSFGGSWMPSSAAVDENHIYFGSSDAQQLYCVNKGTGSTAYQVDVKNYCFASPAITADMIFEGYFNGRMYGIEKSSGEVLWEFQPELSVQNYLGLQYRTGTFNVNPMYNGIDYNYTIADSLYLQRLYRTGAILSSAAVEKGDLYFGSTDSCLYALKTVDIATENVNLGTLIEDTVVNFEISFTIDDPGYDSITFEPKYNNAAVYNAFEFTPGNLEVRAKETQSVSVRFSTSEVSASVSKVPIYIDFWQEGNRSRTTSEITFSLEELPDLIGSNTKKSDILNCYPNPFSDQLTIRYSVLKASPVIISVFNTTGSEVLKFEEGLKSSGIHTLQINESLPAGGYIIKVNSGSDQALSRVVSIKQ